MRMTDYIDRNKTTADILRDWRDQSWKAETGRERLAEINARLTGVTSRLGSTPVTGGGTNKVEEALAVGLAKKEIVARGYDMARDYLRELTPCWERLSEEERYMLTVRYIDREEGNGIPLIMERYHISRSEAYRRSEAALNRLSRLLFW